MADCSVQRRAQTGSLVELGDDAASHVLAHAVAVGVRDFIQRIALARGIQHQQPADRLACVAQHRRLFRHLAVALADAGGVDQHDLAAAQFGKDTSKFAGIAHRMSRHAHQATIDLQLLQRPDPEVVGSQHRDLVAALARHAARGQLGQRGRLAHTGRTNQRVHPARQKFIFGPQHRQVSYQLIARPADRCFRRHSFRQAFNQRAYQLRAESRIHQATEQRRACRLPSRSLAATPKQAVHAAFQCTAQRTDGVLQAGCGIRGQGGGRRHRRLSQRSIRRAGHGRHG